MCTSKKFSPYITRRNKLEPYRAELHLAYVNNLNGKAEKTSSKTRPDRSEGDHRNHKYFLSRPNNVIRRGKKPNKRIESVFLSSCIRFHRHVIGGEDGAGMTREEVEESLFRNSWIDEKEVLLRPSEWTSSECSRKRNLLGIRNKDGLRIK